MLLLKVETKVCGGGATLECRRCLATMHGTCTISGSAVLFWQTFTVVPAVRTHEGGQ